MWARRSRMVKTAWSLSAFLPLVAYYLGTNLLYPPVRPVSGEVCLVPHRHTHTHARHHGREAGGVVFSPVWEVLAPSTSSVSCVPHPLIPMCISLLRLFHAFLGVSFLWPFLFQQAYKEGE